MTDELNPQEVAILIRAQQILKARGLSKEANVKKICEAAGISRKTGYQWANNLNLSDDAELDAACREPQGRTIRKDAARLKADYEKLEKRYRFLKVENEGHKLAWEIHGVDELLAAKKNTTRRSKKKKR